MNVQRSPELSLAPSESVSKDGQAANQSVEKTQRQSQLEKQIAVDEYEARDDYNSADDYRALCTPAVAALVLGLLSAFALFDWWLGLIPLAGIVMGVVALRKIRHQSDELTGRSLAIVGIILSAGFWLGGAGWLG